MIKITVRKIYKILTILLCFLLCFEQSGFAQVAGQLDISGYLTQLRQSWTTDKFRPLHLRYLSYDNLNNTFKLLLDKGDQSKDSVGTGLKPVPTTNGDSAPVGTEHRSVPNIETETKTLLNYFFIGVSLPNDTFWVNLRPDSPDNMIDPLLASTDVGKILLEADVQLKKDTAKWTSPDSPEGREYWDKLYQKAGEIFGSENITIPTLTRPWIVPDEIIIRESDTNAYIYKATLKVMLEEDYLNNNGRDGFETRPYNFDDPRLKELNVYSSQLIRELIIPKLTKEINISKRYAPLRQVYYSLIMAQWFKQKFYGLGGLYSSLIDKRDLSGLTSKEQWSKDTYFAAYQKSFKDGEYNFKEPVRTLFGQSIRSYFSGGCAITGDSVAAAYATGGRITAGANRRLPPELAKNGRFVDGKGGTPDDLALSGASPSQSVAAPSAQTAIKTATQNKDVRYFKLGDVICGAYDPVDGQMYFDFDAIKKALPDITKAQAVNLLYLHEAFHEVIDRVGIVIENEEALVNALAKEKLNITLTTEENGALAACRGGEAYKHLQGDAKGLLDYKPFAAEKIGTFEDPIGDFMLNLQRILPGAAFNKVQAAVFTQEFIKKLEGHGARFRTATMEAPADEATSITGTAAEEIDVTSYAESANGANGQEPRDGGRLKLRPLREDLSKMKLEADDLLPVGLGDSGADIAMRQKIAKIMNGLTVNIVFDQAREEEKYVYAQDVGSEWVNSQVKSLAARDEDMYKVGRALESALEQNIQFQIEKKILSYCQQNSRFLSRQHPLVEALQAYLDRTADPGKPKARLFVAIDGTEAMGFSFGNSIVVNLALIAALDTIDEAVSVLYHEQQHHERYWDRGSLGRGGVFAFINDISKSRLQEHEADLVTPEKLARVGLNTSALSDALLKIAGVRSQQDMTHGNVSRRVLANLIWHKKIDLEGGVTDGRAQVNIPMPSDWRPAEILPNVNERLLADGMSDFRRAVAEAPVDMLLGVLKSLVEKTGADNIDKLLFVISHLGKQVSSDARRAGYSPRQAELMALALLTKAGGTDDWLKLYLVTLGRASERIKEILRRAAVSALQEVNGDPLLDNRGAMAAGRQLFNADLNRAADIAARAFIYDRKVRQGLFADSLEVADDGYLIPAASELWQLANRRKAGQKEFFMQYAPLMTGWYVDNFWNNHPNDHANFLVLVAQLKAAHAHYRQLADVSQQELIGMYDVEVKLKSKLLNDPSAYAYSMRLVEMAIPNHIISAQEAIETLFEIKNEALDILITALRDKNEAAFLQLLAKHPDALLNSLENWHRERRLVELGENSPEIWSWLYETVKSNWHKDSFVFPSSIPDPGKKGLDLADSLGIRYAMEGRDDPITPDAKVQPGLSRLYYAIEIICWLKVRSSTERARMIEEFLGGQEAVSVVNSAPWIALESILRSLGSGGFSNVNAPDDETNEIQKACRDRVLNTLPFLRVRDGLLVYLAAAEDLRQGGKIFGKLSESWDLYGRSWGKIKAQGFSEAHNRWLAPANRGYCELLKRALSSLDIASEPEEARNFYFKLAEFLPPGAERSGVLRAYAMRLVEQLPRGELHWFLNELSRQGQMDRQIYEHFVQVRVKTYREDFREFKNFLKQNINELVTSGDLKLSGLTALDTVLDQILNENLAREVFVAMLGSGKNDAALQALLVPYWYQAMAHTEGLGYYIINNNGRLEVAGVNKPRFVSFPQFMDTLYNISPVVKLMILEKLLLSPNGLLHQSKEADANYGKKEFAAALAQNLPQDGELSGLIRDVLFASGESLEAEVMFLALANPLLSQFLQRPPSGIRTNNTELAEAIKNNLNKHHSFSDKVLAAVGRHDISAYADFLDRYNSITATNVKAGWETEAGISSLYDSLTQSFGFRPTEASSKGPQVSAASGPMNIIVEACQSLGPVGVRFLQVLGQYMDIPEEYQEKFRDIYDSTKGQDKLIAFNTLDALYYAAIDHPENQELAEIKKFIDEDLVSLDSQIGGGSIVTVFLVTVRDRDASGHICETTHQEVLKIRNPNAEMWVRQTQERALKIVDVLERQARQRGDSKSKIKQFTVARRVLRDIGEWVIQDIRDTSFMELDAHYSKAHEGAVATNGMKVRVSQAKRPNNKDVKRESLVPGITLNKLLKLASSPKPIEELIREADDAYTLELLQQAKKEGLAPAEILKRATAAVIEDFSRGLAEPAFTENGRGVYLLHSDVHFGNAIITPDLKAVYLIDRNLYLRMDKADVDFVRKIATGKASDKFATLRAIVDYFLGLPENRGSVLLSGWGFLRRFGLAREIGLKVRASGSSSPFVTMMMVLQELESRNVVIPLRMRIMFKNLASINAMLAKTGAGNFSDYVKAAERNAHEPLAAGSRMPERLSAESVITDKQELSLFVVQHDISWTLRPDEGTLGIQDIKDSRLTALSMAEDGESGDITYDGKRLHFYRVNKDGKEFYLIVTGGIAEPDPRRVPGAAAQESRTQREQQPDKQLDQDPKPQMTRRAFLLGAAGATTAAALIVAAGRLIKEKRLPVPQDQELLDIFKQGESYWRTISDDPENVPLPDRLALGKLMWEIGETVDIGFRQETATGAYDGARRLYSSQELLDAVFGVQREALDRGDFDNEKRKIKELILYLAEQVFRKELRNPQGSGSVASSIERVLEKLVEIGTNPGSFFPSPNREVIKEEVKGFSFYLEVKKRSYITGQSKTEEVVSEKEQQEQIFLMKARLAFQLYYYFPAFKEEILGKRLIKVNIHLADNMADFERMGAAMNGVTNPYAFEVIEAPVHGSYSKAMRSLSFPLRSLYLRQSLGDDISLHEMGHLISYILGWGDERQAEKIARAILKLNSSAYRKVFPIKKGKIILPKADDYGSRDYSKKDIEMVYAPYSPDKETFANLFMLCEIGTDFPEIVNSGITENERDGEEAKAIYSILSAWRQFLLEHGYKGNPPWFKKGKSLSAEANTAATAARITYDAQQLRQSLQDGSLDLRGVEGSGISEKDLEAWRARQAQGQPAAQTQNVPSAAAKIAEEQWGDEGEDVSAGSARDAVDLSKLTRINSISEILVSPRFIEYGQAIRTGSKPKDNLYGEIVILDADPTTAELEEIANLPYEMALFKIKDGRWVVGVGNGHSPPLRMYKDNQLKAMVIIAIHNHPGEGLVPSPEDIGAVEGMERATHVILAGKIAMIYRGLDAAQKRKLEAGFAERMGMPEAASAPMPNAATIELKARWEEIKAQMAAEIRQTGVTISVDEQCRRILKVYQDIGMDFRTLSIPGLVARLDLSSADTFVVPGALITALEKEGLVGRSFEQALLGMHRGYKAEIENEYPAFANLLAQPGNRLDWHHIIQAVADHKYVRWLARQLGASYEDVFLRFNASSIGPQDQLSFADKQKVINALLASVHSVYFDSKGRSVNMQGYLEDYYGPLGVKVSVRFEEATGALREDVIKKALWGRMKTDKALGILNILREGGMPALKQRPEFLDIAKAIEPIWNAEVPIPIVLINSQGRTFETIIVAAKITKEGVSGPATAAVVLPLKNIQGEIILMDVIKDIETTQGVFDLLGKLIHELDHAVLMTVTGRQIYHASIFAEGAAEESFAAFMAAQDGPMSRNGVDGLDYDSAIRLFDRQADPDRGAVPYTAGWLMAHAYRGVMGEQAYFDLFYNPDKYAQAQPVADAFIGDLEQVLAPRRPIYRTLFSPVSAPAVTSAAVGERRYAAPEIRQMMQGKTLDLRSMTGAPADITDDTILVLTPDSEYIIRNGAHMAVHKRDNYYWIEGGGMPEELIRARQERERQAQVGQGQTSGPGAAERGDRETVKRNLRAAIQLADARAKTASDSYYKHSQILATAKEDLANFERGISSLKAQLGYADNNIKSKQQILNTLLGNQNQDFANMGFWERRKNKGANAPYAAPIASAQEKLRELNAKKQELQYSLTEKTVALEEQKQKVVSLQAENDQLAKTNDEAKQVSLALAIIDDMGTKQMLTPEDQMHIVAPERLSAIARTAPAGYIRQTIYLAAKGKIETGDQAKPWLLERLKNDFNNTSPLVNSYSLETLSMETVDRTKKFLSQADFDNKSTDAQYVFSEMQKQGIDLASADLPETFARILAERDIRSAQGEGQGTGKVSLVSVQRDHFMARYNRENISRMSMERYLALYGQTAAKDYVIHGFSWASPKFPQVLAEGKLKPSAPYQKTTFGTGAQTHSVHFSVNESAYNNPIGLFAPIGAVIQNVPFQMMTNSEMASLANDWPVAGDQEVTLDIGILLVPDILDPAKSFDGQRLAEIDLRWQSASKAQQLSMLAEARRNIQSLIQQGQRVYFYKANLDHIYYMSSGVEQLLRDKAEFVKRGGTVDETFLNKIVNPDKHTPQEIRIAGDLEYSHNVALTDSQEDTYKFSHSQPGYTNTKGQGLFVKVTAFRQGGVKETNFGASETVQSSLNARQIRDALDNGKLDLRGAAGGVITEAIIDDSAVLDLTPRAEYIILNGARRAVHKVGDHYEIGAESGGMPEELIRARQERQRQAQGQPASQPPSGPSAAEDGTRGVVYYHQSDVEIDGSLGPSKTDVLAGVWLKREPADLRLQGKSLGRYQYVVQVSDKTEKNTLTVTKITRWVGKAGEPRDKTQGTLQDFLIENGRQDLAERLQRGYTKLPGAEFLTALRHDLTEFLLLRGYKYIEFTDAGDIVGRGFVEFPAVIALETASLSISGREFTPVAVAAGEENRTIGNGIAVGFKTSQGSAYTLNGTSTQRNKTSHAFHDPKDVGVKPTSERTYYVAPEAAKWIGAFQGLEGGIEHRRIYINNEGVSTIAFHKTKNRWVRFDGPFKISNTPQIGLCPLELWGEDSQAGNAYSYNEWHPGNQIVEIVYGDTQIAQKEEQPPSVPGAAATSVTLIKADIFQDIADRYEGASWDPSLFDDEDYLNAEGKYNQEPAYRFRNRIPHYLAAVERLGQIRATVAEGKQLTQEQLILIKTIEVHFRLRGYLWYWEETGKSRVTFPAKVTLSRALNMLFGQVNDLDHMLDFFELMLLRHVNSFAHHMKGIDLGAKQEMITTRIKDITEKYRDPWLTERLDFSQIGSEWKETRKKTDDEKTQEFREQDEIFAIGERHNIMAHGVEEAKGGLRNLLNIILEGRLRSNAAGEWFIGELSGGNSEYKSGPHGPFYAVINAGMEPNTNGAFLWYLVPNTKDQTALRVAIAQASRQGLINSELVANEGQKVITYSEFIAKYAVVDVSSAAASAAGGAAAVGGRIYDADQLRDALEKRTLVFLWMTGKEMTAAEVDDRAQLVMTDDQGGSLRLFGVGGPVDVVAKVGDHYQINRGGMPEELIRQRQEREHQAREAQGQASGPGAVAQARPGESTASVKTADWENTMTAPATLPAKPARFRFIVHALKLSDDPAHLGLIERVRATGRHDPSLEINLLKEPKRISEKPIISTSVIDETHISTWGYGGYILGVPADNILRTGSQFAAMIFGGGQEQADKLYAERDSKGVLSPGEILKKTKDQCNEVVITGRGRSGELVEIEGVFIKIDSQGKPLEEELASKLVALARQNNWPIILINGPLIKYTTPGLGWQDRSQNVQDISPQDVATHVNPGDPAVTTNESGQLVFDLAKAGQGIALAQAQLVTEKAQKDKGTGGINFTGMPIVTQPMISQGRFSGGGAVNALPRTVPVELIKKWQEIERLVKADIMPSPERLREYLQDCYAGGCMDTEIDKVLGCIADILRKEEERGCLTEASLKEILVALEQESSAANLAAALNKISVSPGEPQLIPGA
ncbi:MAG: hypothetical protein Q8O22_05720 [Candidatus Omnitrophota bacterium]|nr:hypothetical protein [Candidatus Omnitrophota bacterium]